MYYVYIIKSSLTGNNYVGITGDIERRLKEHNAGYNKSTRHGKPWRLIYQEEFATRVEARKREVYLKSGIGREYIKNGFVA